jgi:DNA-binding response OmpR family regulator
MAPAVLPGVLRLLIVDDDDALRLLMTTVFKRRNDVEVECVADGEAALKSLRVGSYDAIILDLMLPGTNGFDVIRELKVRAPQLLQRTIVLTAVSQSTLRNFDDEKLVRRLIRKPFELNELVDEVLACGGARMREAH